MNEQPDSKQLARMKKLATLRSGEHVRGTHIQGDPHSLGFGGRYIFTVSGLEITNGGRAGTRTPGLLRVKQAL
jgi:hypothetical protein